MSLKSIVGILCASLLASNTALAAPTQMPTDGDALNQTRVSCTEYKSLTGLDLCDAQSTIFLTQARYDDLIQTHQTGTCLDTIRQNYGTLQCHTLSDPFQAWKGRDVAACESEILACRITKTDVSRRRVTIERTEIPTVRARFIPLGVADMGQ